MKRAIEGIDEADQDRLRSLLHILAVAPAELLSNRQGASVINMYSDKDCIKGFGHHGQVLRYINHPDYNIEILKCFSPLKDRTMVIADPGFLKPTYKSAWEDKIRDMRTDFTFYQGEHYDSR